MVQDELAKSQIPSIRSLHWTNIPMPRMLNGYTPIYQFTKVGGRDGIVLLASIHGNFQDQVRAGMVSAWLQAYNS